MLISVPRLAVLLLCLGAFPVMAESLKVGFGTHKPPYIFEDQARGLEYDIVLAAFAQQGRLVEPYHAPLERLHRMLERAELDAITSTNIASGVPAYYSEIYIEYQNVAISLAARKVQISGIDDLGLYSVSAFQRARFLLGDDFRSMALSNRSYREEARQITRNMLLYAGRVDVIIGDRRIFRAFHPLVEDRVDIHQPVVEHWLFPPTGYRVGFVREADRDLFDQGLAAIIDNGEYQRIEARYADY